MAKKKGFGEQMKKYLTLLIPLLLGILACGMPSTAASLATIPLTKTATTSFTPTVAPSPTPTPQPDLCTVTASVLNLRQAPNNGALIVERLSTDDILTITGENESWYEVIVPSGKRGYVHANYCKSKESR